MLDRIYPAVYNDFRKELIWIQGYVLFARLKNHTKNLAEARKERMATLNNARYAVSQKEGNIIKIIPKFVLLSTNDGLKEIHRKFSSIKELIITGTKKKFLQSSKRQERKMDIQRQKITEEEIEKKWIAITMLRWRSNSVISSVQKFVIGAKLIVSHTLITMITKSLWKLLGFVEHVMVWSIEQISQRERLNPEARKGCDSPTHTTKGVEIGRNDLSLFLQGNKAGSGILRVVPSIKEAASQTISGCKTSDLQEFKEDSCCHIAL